MQGTLFVNSGVTRVFVAFGAPWIKYLSLKRFGGASPVIQGHSQEGDYCDQFGNLEVRATLDDWLGVVTPQRTRYDQNGKRGCFCPHKPNTHDLS